MPIYYPPEILWHYTSASTLLKILESGELWATVFNHLNDTEEVHYARGILAQLLTEEIDRRAATPEIAARWREQGENWLAGAGRPQHQSFYRDTEGVIGVFSLSGDGDSLGQWRAYGGEAPVAIGFRNATLAAIANTSFIRCAYGPDDARLVLTDLVDQLVADIETDQLMETSLRQQFYELAAGVKHLSFKEEKEWRLVTRQAWPKDLRLRATDTRVVPYIPVAFAEAGTWRDVWPDAIAHIRVGPGDHDTLTFDALHKVLGSQSPGPEVDKSEIPYRSLA